MKYIPILFSTPMIRAILEGRKTVTRRVMNPQIPHCNHKLYIEAEWKDSPTEWVFRDGYTYCGFCGAGVSGKNGYKGIKMKCQDGDVLWVRETWVRACLSEDGEGPAEGQEYKIWYKADDEWRKHDWHDDNVEGPVNSPKWKPSIFMPKEACRLFLQVESVSIERLQDISNKDAIREGVIYNGGAYDDVKIEDYEGSFASLQPNFKFKSLWKSINGEQSWDSNPWVWRIEFKQIEQPADFLNSEQGVQASVATKAK